MDTAVTGTVAVARDLLPTSHSPGQGFECTGVSNPLGRRGMTGGYACTGFGSDPQPGIRRTLSQAHCTHFRAAGGDTANRTGRAPFPGTGSASAGDIAHHRPVAQLYLVTVETRWRTGRLTSEHA